MAPDGAEGAPPPLMAPGLTPAEYLVLGKLSVVEYPAGARVLAQHLSAHGVMLSEASVSRLLTELDSRGWTARAGAKGRTLTSAGRRLVRSVDEDRRRNLAYARALDISDVEHVYQLMCARRGVETENARAASRIVSGDDLARISALVADHRERFAAGRSTRLSSMAFHREIAALSGNELLAAMSDTVMSADLDYLEHVLDVLTSAAPNATIALEEHERIVEALRASDEEAAARHMHDHLTRIISEVESYMTVERAPAFNTLLDLALDRARADAGQDAPDA